MAVHSSPVAPPRGDRRRQRTRSAILTAGQRLFAARAMEGVTIDEIVDAADVAKGSFYNHFDDKEGLAAAIVELVQGDCEFHVFAANRDTADPALRVVRAMCVMIAYAVAHPERLRALLSLSKRAADLDEPLNAGLVADLERGLAEGRFSGVTLEAGALVVMGIANIAIVTAMTGRPAAAAAGLATEVGAAMLRALGVAGEDAEAVARAAADDVLSAPSPAALPRETEAGR